jgi:hypothetical protein
MRCTFRTKWENGEVACVCALNHKCIHAKTCEELDFKFDKYDGLPECMKQRFYRREKGAIRQVRRV